MVTLFAIKRPGPVGDGGSVYDHYATSRERAWKKFFSTTPYGDSFSVAVKAYESIGYECVPLCCFERAHRVEEELSLGDALAVAYRDVL